MIHRWPSSTVRVHIRPGISSHNAGAVGSMRFFIGRCCVLVVRNLIQVLCNGSRFKESREIVKRRGYHKCILENAGERESKDKVGRERGRLIVRDWGD